MSKTLLCGIQKTGNTWCRFVLFNYFYLKNGGTRTLTFDELGAPHLIRQKKGPEYDYSDGFPLVFHTHCSYEGKGINRDYEGYPEYFEQFDNLIYIYRNPLDTCISYYHFMSNRDTDRPFGIEIKGIEDLEGFTKWFLPKWIHHVKVTKPHADLVLNYDKLRHDTSDFYRAIELICDGDIDEEVLERAIQLSTFENIKAMSIAIGQPYGLGMEVYNGFFCRDGRSGQFEEKMNVKLVEHVLNECRKEGLTVSHYIQDILDNMNWGLVE